MAADLLPVGPWAFLQLLFGLIAAIVFAKLAVILLAILQELLAALIQTLLTPLQVLRGTYDEDDEDHQNDNGNGPANNAPVADGGAHEPPPNVPWPPDDAFEEDNRHGNR